MNQSIHIQTTYQPSPQQERVLGIINDLMVAGADLGTSYEDVIERLKLDLWAFERDQLPEVDERELERAHDMNHEAEERYMKEAA